MANRVGGITFLTINGVTYDVRGNATCSPTRTERAGVAGLDRVHGFTEVPRVPFIQLDLTTTPGMLIEDVDGLEDATVQVQLANGNVYTLYDAWRAGASEINAREGQFQGRFEGIDCVEFVGGP